jgi:transglutaminase-like putative cysteine protease
MGTTDRQSSPTAVWNVECHLTLDVVVDATIVLQIAPAPGAGAVLSDRFEVALDGRPLAVRRLEGEHGTIVHVLRSPVGNLTVDMATTVDRTPPAEAPSAVPSDEALDVEQLTYLRQSRYCPSDRLGPFMAHELGHLSPGPEMLAEVGDWVAGRLVYREGSSGPLDSAIDTLFAGRGVCRDFAHLAVTALRALGVPARLVAVYAPGLWPMDFHAVVEAHIDGRWCVLDPTRLAPRTSLLRVSTGRDAADTAFLTVLGGEALLYFTEIVAFTDGDLPVDDHTGLVSLA